MSTDAMQIAAPLPLLADSNDRKAWEDFLTRALVESLQRIPAGNVSPDLDFNNFRDSLEAFDFETQPHLSDLQSRAIEQLEHGVVHLNHVGRPDS
jgi:hypothetical protein